MRRKDQDNCEPASNDPAAVIAQALRRKFANRMFQDSPGMDTGLSLSVLHLTCFIAALLR